MTAKECIKGRRSIREFKPDPIDKEVLSDIVLTASYSPSWKNTQITRYIAVEGALKDQIAREATTDFPNNGRIIQSSPMLIAVTIVKNRSGFERDGSYSTFRQDGWQMFDAGIASQTFCLAAYEKGIGSVILGLFDHDKASELLNIPDDRDLITLIPIGYPVLEPEAPKRKPVEDLLFYQ